VESKSFILIRINDPMSEVLKVKKAKPALKKSRTLMLEDSDEENESEGEEYSGGNARDKDLPEKKTTHKHLHAHKHSQEKIGLAESKDRADQSASFSADGDEKTDISGDELEPPEDTKAADEHPTKEEISSGLKDFSNTKRGTMFPYVTSYEFQKIVIEEAERLSRGGLPRIRTKQTDYIEIAMESFYLKKLPYVIVRRFPGGYTKIKLKSLKLLKSYTSAKTPNVPL
jgi:hypothetical protein